MLESVMQFIANFEWLWILGGIVCYVIILYRFVFRHEVKISFVATTAIFIILILLSIPSKIG